MNKEELMLQKHLIDLSETAYKRDIVTFSDFLNLNELNILHSTPKNMFSANYETYGGYEASERQMVAFLPDALYYEYSYPVSVLKIVPSAPKFAEQLTHRDYLGAVLNLGIERCKIGDLLIGEKECILFVCDSISRFIIDNLTRIPAYICNGRRDSSVRFFLYTCFSRNQGYSCICQTGHSPFRGISIIPQQINRIYHRWQSIC